jgi:predicted nucleic acid-binding protein
VNPWPSTVRVVDELIRERRDLFVEPHVDFELYRGVRGAPDPRAALRWINRIGERFRILPFEREAAQLAAQMDQALRRDGLQIPNIDLFIAASSLVWGDGEVVTRDTAHFRCLRRFGLRLREA